MKIAIISDIHGNYTALSAVWNEIQSSGIDTTICLGDVVGYGPHPLECIELLRENDIQTILGNHDEVLMKPELIVHFTKFAKASMEWTIQQLGDSQQEWLTSLPEKIIHENVTCTHASLSKYDKWEYITNSTYAADSMDEQSTPLCFVGHTHITAAYIEDPFAKSLEPGDIQIEEDVKYLINPGSVGQPRDRDNRAAWGIFNTESTHYQQMRTTYDIAKTQADIRKNRLPEFLATRLETGE